MKLTSGGLLVPGLVSKPHNQEVPNYSMPPISECFFCQKWAKKMFAQKWHFSYFNHFFYFLSSFQQRFLLILWELVIFKNSIQDPKYKFEIFPFLSIFPYFWICHYSGLNFRFESVQGHSTTLKFLIISLLSSQKNLETFGSEILKMWKE